LENGKLKKAKGRAVKQDGGRYIHMKGGGGQHGARPAIENATYTQGRHSSPSFACWSLVPR